MTLDEIVAQVSKLIQDHEKKQSSQQQVRVLAARGVGAM